MTEAARDACRITPAARDRAVEQYTALHEGLPPRRLLCERWDPPAGGVVRAIHAGGRGGEAATEIQYRKRTLDKGWLARAGGALPPGWRRLPSGEYSYHHPWAAQAQPRIGVDAAGRLWFWAGRYETRRRGIEDRVTRGMTPSPYLTAPYVQLPERLPLDPRELTTLGRLEWIKYKWTTPGGAVRERTLRWPARLAPEIAHDQDGNLHVLGGNYVVTERGVEEPMAQSARTRSRSSSSRRARGGARGRSSYGNAGGGYANTGGSYDNPSRGGRGRRRRSSSGGRRRNARGQFRNPSTALAYGNPTRTASRTVTVTEQSRAMAPAGNSGAYRMILNSFVVGGVAVLTAVAMDLALARVAWSPLAKALTKIGVGVGGGVGLALLIRDERFAAIPAGFSVGGVVDGLRDLWDLYVAPRLAGVVAPPATTTTSTTSTTTTTTPAAQAYLPIGVPPGYQAYNPQACGVGVY